MYKETLRGPPRGKPKNIVGIYKECKSRVREYEDPDRYSPITYIPAIFLGFPLWSSNSSPFHVSHTQNA